jgi:hypothetical protein
MGSDGLSEPRQPRYWNPRQLQQHCVRRGKPLQTNERGALHPGRRAYLLRGSIGYNGRPLEAPGTSGESTELRRRGRARTNKALSSDCPWQRTHPLIVRDDTYHTNLLGLLHWTTKRQCRLPTPIGSD